MMHIFKANMSLDIVSVCYHIPWAPAWGKIHFSFASKARSQVPYGLFGLLQDDVRHMPQCAVAVAVVCTVVLEVGLFESHSSL
jgi:hypothetical protein